MDRKTRRDFLRRSATLGAGVAAMIGPKDSWAGANETIRVACIGIRGRGGNHMHSFQALENVEVVALSDVDENVLRRRADEFERRYGRRPRTEWDMRRILADPTIDVVSFATPNHWHALGTIWACQAGKDVYVEKPASHNVWEGRKMVEAARKYNRIVQYGVQLRSSPAIQEAVEHMRKGTIGTVYMARGLCFRHRPTIGKKSWGPVPPGVHYDMWLGPAPKRPFHENRFHYNWHYMWDYGNGDLGNQGVHEMDLCMWGLGVTLPTEICAMGGKYIWPDDDKEIPNVITACYRYPKENVQIVFDVRPWLTNDEEGVKVGNIFYGSEGILIVKGYDTYRILLDPDRGKAPNERGKRLEPGPTRTASGNHYANFIEAVRSRRREDLNAEIEQGHYSAALCHLGLIALRVKRQLQFDPKTERIIGDPEANKLLKHAGRPPDYVIPEGV